MSVQHPIRFFTCFSILALLAILCGERAVRAASPEEQKEKAISVLEQSVKTDPANTELWLHLGFAYRKASQIDSAQSAFEKVAALNPKESTAFYMLGLIYESKHQTQEALYAWKSDLATESDPAKRDIAQKHIHQLSQ